jgi:hypothetical protein
MILEIVMHKTFPREVQKRSVKAAFPLVPTSTSTASTTQPFRMSEVVLYSVKNNICTVTLNDPTVFNALSPELVKGLTAAMERADKDPTVRSIRSENYISCSFDRFVL